MKVYHGSTVIVEKPLGKKAISISIISKIAIFGQNIAINHFLNIMKSG